MEGFSFKFEAHKAKHSLLAKFVVDRDGAVYDLDGPREHGLEFHLQIFGGRLQMEMEMTVFVPKGGGGRLLPGISIFSHNFKPKN